MTFSWAFFRLSLRPWRYTFAFSEITGGFSCAGCEFGLPVPVVLKPAVSGPPVARAAACRAANFAPRQYCPSAQLPGCLFALFPPGPRLAPRVSAGAPAQYAQAVPVPSAARSACPDAPFPALTAVPQSSAPRRCCPSAPQPGCLFAPFPVAQVPAFFGPLLRARHAPVLSAARSACPDALSPSLPAAQAARKASVLRQRCLFAQRQGCLSWPFPPQQQAFSGAPPRCGPGAVSPFPGFLFLALDFLFSKLLFIFLLLQFRGLVIFQFLFLVFLFLLDAIHPLLLLQLFRALAFSTAAMLSACALMIRSAVLTIYGVHVRVERGPLCSAFTARSIAWCSNNC